MSSVLLCACVLLLCHVPNAGASEATPGGNLVIRSWGTEHGLPQNTVNAIVQSRDGYLWLATRDGLARFDGVRFTVFGLREGLRSVDISALYEDRSGTLWVGTIGGGLSRLAKNQLESVPLPNRQGPSDIINCLAEDAQGRLWIGTAAGLAVWDNGEVVQMEALAPVAHSPIRALLRGRSGVMWISTLQGLFKYDAGHLSMQPGPSDSERLYAYCLLQDSRGQLWASVGNGRVLCLQDGGWRVYDQTNGLPFAYVTCLAEESDGTIWAGSLDSGLYYSRNGQFVAVREEHGLSANDIRSLRQDREGNLWVGTRTGGLNRISERKLLACGAAQGLTNDFTRSVTQSADGTIWVATTGGGLYAGGPEQFRRFAPESVFQFYASVESVLAASDGSLWWGSRGVLRWQNGKLTGCYTNDPWIRTGMATALAEDGRGGLWAGTSEGRLAHFEQGRFEEFPVRVARGPITALVQEPKGGLWVGSIGGGLRRIQPGSNAVFTVTNLISHSIRTLRLDSEGALWIGTSGGGLARWRDGAVTTFTTQQGLGANTISQIVEDDAGFLWLGSNRGIFRVRKSELNDLAAGKLGFLHPRAYGVNDGMPAEECSGGFCPAGLKTASGLVCFSTVKGLVFLDPHQQDGAAEPPEVLLEEMLVNGKAQARVLDPELPEGRFVIPPGGRELEVHYTAISFDSPEKISFRYQLAGLDPDWVEAGTRRTAYYRVPPGEFTFRVIACNADGLWNEEGVEVGIEVQRHLWETRWFHVSAGLVVLGLIGAAARVAERRKYRRRLLLLQTQHAIERERLRISQDMHDHVGGMLTQVSQLSDLGQSESANPAGSRAHFEKIGLQSRAAVQALDEIVWATNPRNDNLPRFAEYVCGFADELFESTPVRCWQEVPTALPNAPLRADLRHNVFLAVREAFHNIVKHAQASEVWLRLTLENSHACLEIQDNGCGFNPERPAHRGNGLDNMSHRLSECGGSAEIKSAPGEGTRIRFLFPLDLAESAGQTGPETAPTRGI